MNSDKEKVLTSIGNDLNFKSAFKATLGFYVAKGIIQLLVMTLSVIATLVVLHVIKN